MRLSPNLTSPIARTLYAYKDDRKLTLKEMAEEVQVNWLSLRRLFRGGKLGSVKTVKHLAKIFGWTAGEVGAMAMFEGAT